MDAHAADSGGTLAAVKGKQLIRRLEVQGVKMTRKRGKGGHVLAEHEGRQAPIPMHGDQDLSPVFVKKLCKQLGIDPDEIL